MRRLVGWLSLSVAMVGCGPGSDGELGRGRFVYGCDRDDDWACSSPDNDGPIESFDSTRVGVVAIDGWFRLSFEGARVVPASSSMVERSGSFRFREEGEVAFFALDDQNELIDFLHVAAWPVEGIELGVEGPETFFEPALPEDTLRVGERADLAAYPVSGQVHLRGSLGCSWSSSDESVVSLQFAGPSCRREVVPAAAGTVEITVTMANLVESRLITVVEPEESQP